MKIPQLLFTVLLCLLAINVNAEQATDHLVKIFQGIDTIKGNFTQTIIGQDGKTVIATSKGNFILQRPDHFRWNVITPPKQLTVADGKHIWQYQPDLQQVTISPMSQKIEQTPLAVLSGSAKALGGNYRITQTDDGNTFILTSKHANTEFHRIELTIRANKIKCMILFDSLGQKTEFIFNHIVLNKRLPAKTFKFTAPKGVDVIRN